MGLLIASALIAGLSACGGSGTNSASNTDGQTSHTVMPSVSAGGSISPSGAILVQAGKTTVFTLAPNSGYSPSVGGTCGGTLTGSTYTTNAIVASCTVMVTFTASSATPLKFTYESPQATVDTGLTSGFLSVLNQEGVKNYFYQADYSGNSFPFVSDGTKQIYNYELWMQPDFSSVTGLVAFMNEKGSRGYRYEADFWLYTSHLTENTGASYMLFRKDSGSSATYTYATDTTPANMTNFLTQTNVRGQSGYLLDSSFELSSSNVILYVRNNVQNAIYVYEILAWPTTQSSLLAQLNSEGSKGYRALDSGFFPVQNAIVYVKDQTQTATFTYQLATGSAPPAISQKNSYGAQGYAYWGSILLPTAGSTGNFYIKANNCQGILCTASNPPVDVSTN
jgi:hypothetical protein